MDIVIRPATPADFAALKAIEIDAFETLRTAGAVAGEATSSSDEDFCLCLDAGILLAAVDDDDVPVGYAGALIEAGLLHVVEIDVARTWQRRGIGRGLMQSMIAEARRRDLGKITLTTDRHAPFNAPFYASLGFREICEDELSGFLRQTLEKEAASGLDPARRVAMQIVFG